MSDITIVEVGPRDGLQNEKRIVPTIDKLRLIELLTDAGLSRIEVTAFVSPRWVPQMADHETVLRNVPRAKGVIRSVLVPNEKGAANALGIGVEEVAVFTSASETFAQRNINCSIAESIERFVPIAALAHEYGARLRGYVSCTTECPLKVSLSPKRRLRWWLHCAHSAVWKSLSPTRLAARHLIRSMPCLKMLPRSSHLKSWHAIFTTHPVRRSRTST